MIIHQHLDMKNKHMISSVYLRSLCRCGDKSVILYIIKKHSTTEGYKVDIWPERKYESMKKPKILNQLGGWAMAIFDTQPPLGYIWYPTTPWLYLIPNHPLGYIWYPTTPWLYLIPNHPLAIFDTQPPLGYNLEDTPAGWIVHMINLDFFSIYFL